MAESFTSYSVDNDRAFRNGLKRAAEVVSDLRIPLGLISADFYKSEASIFKLKSEGQYPKISDKYGARKQKLRGFKYPLLFYTGRLAQSVLGPSNPGSINKIGPLSLTIGTSVEYGIYHQSDKPRSKIPLRKFLFIGPEAKRFASSEQQGRLERWNNILNDYVLKKLKGQSNG